MEIFICQTVCKGIEQTALKLRGIRTILATKVMVTVWVERQPLAPVETHSQLDECKGGSEDVERHGEQNQGNRAEVDQIYICSRIFEMQIPEPNHLEIDEAQL